jgi:hypothetical protein
VVGIRRLKKTEWKKNILGLHSKMLIIVVFSVSVLRCIFDPQNMSAGLFIYKFAGWAMQGLLELFEGLRIGM